MKAGDSTLIESFLDMMSAERGASINTLSAYRRDLLDFSGHRAAKGDDAQELQRAMTSRPISACSSRSGVTGSTQARRLSALAAVLRLSLFRRHPQGRSDGRDRGARSASARCQKRCRMTTWMP